MWMNEDIKQDQNHHGLRKDMSMSLTTSEQMFTTWSEAHITGGE
jgi:hypothetical protein